MSSAVRAFRDELRNALGEAVIAAWSDLPQPVQELLFERAVTAAQDGEAMRAELAFLLHGMHARTRAASR